MTTVKAHPPDWIEPLARAGYLAKGIVYALIGYLALRAALGQGGGTASQEGALATVLRAPGGQVLLFLIGAGLVAYSAWRFVQAAMDPENDADGASGAVKRVGWAVSGVVYLALGISAFSGLGGGGGAAGLVADAMRQPWGRWLVGLAGAAIIGTGLYQFAKAAKKEFMERMTTREEWLERAGQAGFAARGVVYVVIGILVIQAAVTYDPSRAGGIGAALAALRDQPYGPWLMGLVAAGLVLYGVFAAMQARYRRIGV